MAHLKMAERLKEHSVASFTRDPISTHCSKCALFVVFVHLGAVGKIGSLTQKQQAYTLLKAFRGDFSDLASPRIISYCTGL